MFVKNPSSHFIYSTSTVIYIDSQILHTIASAIFDKQSRKQFFSLMANHQDIYKNLAYFIFLIFFIKKYLIKANIGDVKYYSFPWYRLYLVLFLFTLLINITLLKLYLLWVRWCSTRLPFCVNRLPQTSIQSNPITTEV